MLVRVCQGVGGGTLAWLAAQRAAFLQSRVGGHGPILEIKS